MHVLFQTSTPYMNDNFAYVFVHGGNIPYSRRVCILEYFEKSTNATRSKMVLILGFVNDAQCFWLYVWLFFGRKDNNCSHISLYKNEKE